MMESCRKILKLFVGMVILKLLSKLSCMVSRMLVCQVTVIAYISAIVSILIVTSHLLFFSQSRIAPIKTQTIQRLDLQATLFLAKSIKNVYESVMPVTLVNLLCSVILD